MARTAGASVLRGRATSGSTGAAGTVAADAPPPPLPPPPLTWLDLALTHDMRLETAAEDVAPTAATRAERLTLSVLTERSTSISATDSSS